MANKRPKLDPEVFRRAAELVHSGTRFSCVALEAAHEKFFEEEYDYQDNGDGWWVNSTFHLYDDAYRELFGPKPREDTVDHPYWTDSGLHTGGWVSEKKRAELRVLALLFMADIIEAGDY